MPSPVHFGRKEEEEGAQSSTCPWQNLSLPIAASPSALTVPLSQLPWKPSGLTPTYPAPPFCICHRGSQLSLITPVPNMAPHIPTLLPFPPAQLPDSCAFWNPRPSAGRSSIVSTSALKHPFTFWLHPGVGSPLTHHPLKQ